MSEPRTFSRKACLADFIDDNKAQSTHNNKYSHDDTNTIAKNQQEFGHKKRIKP
uniref:Uncharacterized protein n=1 Tax=viral metagenome TaxID=1070528 RepID=A0A6C0HYA2_9ZZZZ